MSTPNLTDAVAVRLSEVAGVANLLEHVVQNGHGLPADPLARLLVDLNKVHALLQKHRHAIGSANGKGTGS